MPAHPANAAILLAAGRGMRMGETLDGPKQYQAIGTAGQTVLGKAVDAFLGNREIGLVQVVIHPDDMELYENSVTAHPKLLAPVFGGATRQESGLKGLAALETHNPEKVLIHDAARPFLSSRLIETVLEAIDQTHCALPAIGVSDTVKRASSSDEGRIVEDTIPRDEVFLAQTPQGFSYPAILEAHQKAARMGLADFTDDCAIAEWAGMKVRLVDGEAQNRKITTIHDLTISIENNNMDRLLKLPDVRTGVGYDVHRLVPGDGIILCGVLLPSKMKLDGHSDADVALHAITDALLGTIGEGDIGSHFPPSDPVWKGASSDRFLEHACTLVREKDGVISHLDVTIICEEPKVGPHREAMREKVAAICGIETGRVSVKATTHERIGTIGRGEGISAMATATVVMTA